MMNGSASAPAPAPADDFADDSRNPMLTPETSTHHGDAILDLLLDAVARCTRYPRENLALDLDFEDDLGIDSVKRAEILALLTEQLELGPDALDRLGAARTLRSLASALEPEPVESKSVGSTPVEPHAVAPLPREPRPSALIHDRLRQLMAQVTRYPAELLTLDADLEDELGIDSVKLQEILAVAQQSFPGLAGHEPPSALRTARQLGEWIATHAPPAAPERTAPERTAPERLAADGAAPSLRAVAAGTTSEVPPPADIAHRFTLAERCFEGKVALISGSGHGLGRVTALELARRGASVVINSFHHRELGEATAEEVRRAGGDAQHVWASMARADQVRRLFAEVEQRHGGLDFFIHNASNGVFARLCDATEDDWLKSFRTNMLGLHQGALQARALMQKRGGGKILTISSVFHDSTMDYFGVQGPIKAGVESLTRFLAKEFMPDNIQVNCVSLGALEGEAMSQYPETHRIVESTERRSLGQRRMTELEAARVQLLLLGAEADSITGSVFRADRGMLVA